MWKTSYRVKYYENIIHESIIKDGFFEDWLKMYQHKNYNKMTDEEKEIVLRICNASRLK